MMTKQPNFIVAGFPKCGSTALHYYLDEHPEIFMSKQKELHFFTNQILAKQNNGAGDKEVKSTQIKSLEAYKNCFKNVKNEIAIGDTSPSYINYPEVFPKIKAQLNNPKVIILLRDPIKRAHSNYLHLIREHRETLDFYNALLQEKRRKELNYSDFWYYTFNSLYFDKIVEAKKIFDHVLILTQEELNKNTPETVKKVFSFLGVSESFIPQNLDRRYNPGGSYKTNFITRFIFKRNKFSTILRKNFFIPTWAKHIKHKILKKYQIESPVIDYKSEEILVEAFREDVKKLKEIGVDVSSWNEKYFL